MRFTPKSQEEVYADRRLLPEGEYDFQTLVSKEKTSAAGNEMFMVKLDVFCGGTSIHLFDNLMSSTKMAWKLRHFCYATGIGAKYETGSLNESDLVAARGKVVLGVEQKAGFPPRNKVEDYVVTEPEAMPARIESPRQQKHKFTPPPADQAMAITEDSIPFD